MRTRRRGARALIGLVGVLAIVAAACSKSSSPSTTPSNPPASSSPSAAGITVQQGAGGFVFAPSTVTVKNGESVSVTNVGAVPHTFTITGKGIDVLNNPGQSQSVTINLASGTYQFICRFHVGLGMKGTLTVTS